MNYYDVLRIDKNASSQEIKDSYKKLIKRYHPDLYPGNKVRAESITRDLNEAYEVLSDPEKKAMYDLSLQELSNPYATSKPPKQNDFYKQEDFIEEAEPPTWDEQLKEKIHAFVDKKSKNMSNEAKHKVLILIIFIAIFIFLITALDYLNFQVVLQEKQQNIQKQELIYE